MTHRHALALALGLAALAAPAPGADPPRYDIHPIEPVHDIAHCIDLNDRGEVVGYLHPSGSIDSVSFVWRDGVMTVLPGPEGAQTVWPSSIADDGMIYGSYHEWSTNALLFQPLAWREGVLRELPGVFEGVGARLFASPSGEHIVTNSQPFHHGTPGWSDEFGWDEEPDFTVDSRDEKMPYAYSAGVTRPLGTFRASEQPYVAAVNDRGAAVGWIWTDGWNQYDAVLWDPDHGPLLMGSGGRRHAWPRAINREGVVVGLTRSTRDGGDVNTDYHMRPFVWSAGRWEHLEPSGIYKDGEAVDINDAGEVVGVWREDNTSYGPAAAWLRAEGVVTLLDELVDPTEGWTFSHVAGINDHGEILAGEHLGTHLNDTRWALLVPRR